MMFAEMTIHTGAAGRIVAQMDKPGAERIAIRIRDLVEVTTRTRFSATTSLPPAPAATGMVISVAAELRELATLRDEGILTPAEFDRQKAHLLAG